MNDGTCGGFQHAVMEYAQNVLGMAEVNHEEYNTDASTFFITVLSCSLLGETRKLVGTDTNGEVRILELPQNRFYVATLFQPRLGSIPENPHKLIVKYLLAAQEFHNECR